MKELVNLIKDNKVLFACVAVATCLVLGLLAVVSHSSETVTAVEASDAGVTMSEDSAVVSVDAGMTTETTVEDTGVVLEEAAVVEEN